jgi:hypothetical protein
MDRQLHNLIHEAKEIAYNQGIDFKQLCDECGVPPRTFRRWKSRELQSVDEYRNAAGDRQRKELLEKWIDRYDDEVVESEANTDEFIPNSQAKSSITRKANKWWKNRHEELVREYEDLGQLDLKLHSTSTREDWVTHVTDLHAGDRVRRDDGAVVYSTDEIPDVVDHITGRSLALADHHSTKYDTAHLLWGGDMVTGEGIYEQQHEDIDAYLDKQHDTLVDPLVRQVREFSDRFDSVQIVTQVGNHGEYRASGVSRQANADLILYKTIRNIIAQLQKTAGVLENVQMKIGEAKPYRNFSLRGGKLKGHLRHGQHRRPQAETSARHKEWLSTLLDHSFDVAYMGHHHVSGRIPWDGPPVIVTGSPKPTDEFVEKLGVKTPSRYRSIATAHGVSDQGVTGIYDIDTRNYQ